MNFKTLILITITATISTLGIAWGNESIKQDLKKISTPGLIKLNTELEKIKISPSQGPIDFMPRISESKKEKIRIDKINDVQRETEAELKRRENLDSPDSIPIKYEFQSYEIEAKAKAKAKEAELIIQRLLDEDLLN